MEKCLQDHLSCWIRDKVEVDRILSVEQEGLDEGGNRSGSIVAGTHNGNMNNLTGFD